MKAQRAIYQDIKTDSIRSLPDGWRWVRLGDVCEKISNGTTYPQNASRIGIPVTRIETISNGNINNERVGWLDIAEINVKNYILNPGDILFSHINSVERLGNCALYDGAPPILVHGMNLLRIELKKDIADSGFLFNYLRSKKAKSFYIERARRAIGQASLNTKDMSELDIPLPSLPEQKRIAAILNEQMAAVEKARDAADKQLEAAQALPAAYIRKVFNSSDAKEWPRKRFGDLSKITAKQVDPKIPEFGSLPHVNGENIESGTCRLTNIKTAAEDKMISGKYLFEAGDVLYSKLRPYLRKVVVADFRGVCSADMYPIRVNGEYLEPYYTAWMLVSDEFTRYADEESRRARMPKLNRSQLFAWYAPVPTISEQKKIVAILKEQMNAVDCLLRILEEQHRSLEKLPGIFLLKAFNGEI